MGHRGPAVAINAVSILAWLAVLLSGLTALVLLAMAGSGGPGPAVGGAGLPAGLASAELVGALLAPAAVVLGVGGLVLRWAGHAAPSPLVWGETEADSATSPSRASP
jgi:hypothetical protein